MYAQDLGAKKRPQRRPAPFGAKYYTPELTKVKFHWKVPMNIHWQFPVKSTGKVTILWKMPLESEHPLENTTDNHWNMPLKSKIISEVSISGVQSFASLAILCYYIYIYICMILS